MASRVLRYNALIVRPSSGSRLPPLPTTRDIIKMYKLSALKQLSQNFLMDERLTARIVRQSGKITGEHVIEVGPGPGSLTRKRNIIKYIRKLIIYIFFVSSKGSILRRGPKQLIVVEKDDRFIQTMNLLKNAVQPSIQMDVFCDDILKFNINEEKISEKVNHDWNAPLPPLHIIGNLPFAISTRLLINWLKDISLKRNAWQFGRTDMVLTFQKEVGERIIAPIGDDQRCRLSVMSQIWTRPELRFLIPGKAFVPKPEVDVAVVRFVPLKEPMTTLPFDLVEKVMRYLFSMRQKKVGACIANLYPMDLRKDLTARTFQLAEVNSSAKSFELSNEECLRLAQAYSLILSEQPHIGDYDYRARRSRPYQVDTLNQSDVDYLECEQI